MRKMLYLTMVGLLVVGAGRAEGDVPQDRDPVLPGDDFPTYPAATLVKVAQSGCKFLSYPLGARPAALAGAFSTVTGDAHSLFWNPAGLAFMKARSGQGFGGHAQWIADIKYDYGGVAYNADGVNAFGFGLMTVDNGEFQGAKVKSADPKGYEVTNKFEVKEWMATLGYARKITDRFSIGGSFKIMHQDLGKGNILDPYNKPTTINNTANSWAVDLGTYFNTGFRSVALGVNVNNFARTQDYQGDEFEMPRRVAMAFGADLFALANSRKENHKAFIHFDVEKPHDFSERPLLGGEYIYASSNRPVSLALRAGYRFNHDTERFSGGGGLKYQTGSGRGVSVDYAYKRFDGSFFSDVHMISGSVNF